jgi:hypothetical protein
MIVTYLFLANADTVLGRIGPRGIDAATRIVGFFVSAMGMGLIFHGVNGGDPGLSGGENALMQDCSNVHRGRRLCGAAPHRDPQLHLVQLDRR